MVLLPGAVATGASSLSASKPGVFKSLWRNVVDFFQIYVVGGKMEYDPTGDRRQADMGYENEFYYDENERIWKRRGGSSMVAPPAGPPAAVAVPPPAAVAAPPPAAVAAPPPAPGASYPATTEQEHQPPAHQAAIHQASFSMPLVPQPPISSMKFSQTGDLIPTPADDSMQQLPPLSVPPAGSSTTPAQASNMIVPPPYTASSSSLSAPRIGTTGGVLAPPPPGGTSSSTAGRVAPPLPGTCPPSTGAGNASNSKPRGEATAWTYTDWTTGLEVSVGPAALPKTLAELNQNRWESGEQHQTGATSGGPVPAVDKNKYKNRALQNQSNRRQPQEFKPIVAASNPFDYS